MRTQVKLFNDEDLSRLEKDINDFLKNVELVDVKYTSSRLSEPYNEEVAFSALLIYKETKK